FVHRLSQAAPDVVVADPSVRCHAAGTFPRLGDGGSRNEQGDGGASGPNVRLHRVVPSVIEQWGSRAEAIAESVPLLFLIYVQELTCHNSAGGCTFAVHRGERRPGMVR